jgi:hypothetical protein
LLFSRFGWMYRVIRGTRLSTANRANTQIFCMYETLSAHVHSHSMVAGGLPEMS